MKTKALSIAGGGLALALLAGTVAIPLVDDVDYETIPPEPAVTASKLVAVQGKLIGAIGAVEKKTGGIAKSARVLLDATPPAVEVIAYDATTAWRVTVDLASGQVRDQTAIPRFPGDPVSGNWTETESGLKYYEIKVGDGPTPGGPTSIVKVHYSGWLNNGEMFDSSVERDQPASFPLNRVIAGWTEGVGSMRVGGKRKLIIPYALAYGERGRSGIPGKATLIFDVELLEVNE